MLARTAGWLLLAGIYALAHVTLEASGPSFQEPRLLEALDEDGRELVLAAFAALAVVVGVALARVWVPDPWASRAVVVVALSPAGFALSGSTAAIPAALLAAGLLGALHTRDKPTRLRTLGGAACLALAPWFGLGYAVPGAVALLALAYWSYRRGRRLYAFLALEFGGATAVTLGGVEISEPAASAPGAQGVLEVLAGAPFVVLAVVSVALVVRSRREHLSRAIPAWRDAEVGVGLAAAIVAVMLGVAIVAPIGPEAAIPLAAALAGLGARSLRWVGVALAAATLGLTAWAAVLLAAGEARGWL